MTARGQFAPGKRMAWPESDVPATGRDDQITRTARQVRYANEREIHALASDDEPADGPRLFGRHYLTRCGDVLSASLGAMLTTRDVNCRMCQP